MTDSEKLLTFFGVTLGVGIIIAIANDEDVPENLNLGAHLMSPNSTNLDLGLTRTEALTPAREESRESVESTKVEKVSLPSLSTKIPSTISRSWETLPSGKFLTSRKIDNSTIPSNAFIRKYPPHYYNLSKKSQWKYRKSRWSGSPSYCELALGP
jgi:hypothetical protein